MISFRNFGLLTKITLIVVAILLVFFLLNALFHYRQQRAIILDEALEKARQASFHAIHAREYLSEQYLLSDVEFSRQRYGLIPVVASNRIGQRVAADLGYHIRQTSDRYRNPDNAPDPFEKYVIEKFRQPGGPGEYFAQTTLGGEAVFRYLRAFAADESCLQCHGDPARAPAFLHEIFPPDQDRAYYYQLGEVIGAASIVIPMESLLAQIQANLRQDLHVTGAIFLALMASLGLLIRVAVIRPLARLSAGINDIVSTGRFEQRIPRRGRDEIGSLIDGFNGMMEHLGEKSRHLEESERRFRALTETARDGIISFLGTGQIILFNRQAERIFGYSKREAIGMSLAKLIHPDFAELHELGVEDYLRRHGEELTRELKRLPGCRRDGKAVPMELSLSSAVSDGHLFYTAIVRLADESS